MKERSLSIIEKLLHSIINSALHSKEVHESLSSPLGMVWTLYQQGKIDELNKVLYQNFPDYYCRPVEKHTIPEDKLVPTDDNEDKLTKNIKMENAQDLKKAIDTMSRTDLSAHIARKVVDAIIKDRSVGALTTVLYEHFPGYFDRRPEQVLSEYEILMGRVTEVVDQLFRLEEKTEESIAVTSAFGMVKTLIDMGKVDQLNETLDKTFFGDINDDPSYEIPIEKL